MSPIGGLGAWGEELAIKFLLRQGLRIVERNFYTTAGEIDIVAEKGGDFYFVEVKTRLDKELATDLAITYAKRRKLNKTIKRYCYERKIAGGVGLILAAVIVFPDRLKKTVRLRWVVLR
ncbi:MAG: YraN family protein [bacterium]|nr:YraN family protein [bacterium]